MSEPYVHAHYEPVRRKLRFWIRVVTGLLVKTDKFEGVENVPLDGPLILYGNHIALIDPIMIIHALPRNIIPLAKIETYAYPLIGIFPKLWHVIPVRRGEVDRDALRACLDVLAADEIIWVAPEGTRRPAFEEAKDGLAYIASRSGAPLLPIAVDGTIGFPALPFSKRWKGPGVHLKFGRPFRFKSGARPPARTSGRCGRAELAQMTAEAMYVLSAILPPERRGVFADLSQATQETIQWL
ncbi:MAG: 1-acyl-sn-glycerol-3-phosphate acyltransferase [Chloroflexi bacterium]|nr:1-acyl-sn-glycerol-3-phosphate acyltransferase [Chloroflexota bacterium]